MTFKAVAVGLLLALVQKVVCAALQIFGQLMANVIELINAGNKIELFGFLR